MPALLGTAAAFCVAISVLVRPEAQSTAFALIGVVVLLGIALKIRDGFVW